MLELTATPALEKGESARSVLEAFLASRDSENTRRAYRRHLEGFLAFCGVPQWRSLSPSHLVGFRAAITSSGRGPATHSQVLAAVRAFLRWAGVVAGAHNLPTEQVREALRTPSAVVARPYHVLSDLELGRLLGAGRSPRDQAAVAVLAGAGLRVSELVGLNRNDVVEDENGWAVVVRRGKGRRGRIVPIREDVANAVRVYLVSGGRRLGVDAALFLAEDRASVGRGVERRISSRGVALVIDRLARRARIDAKRVSPHSLRHTFAIRFLRRGGNVVALSKLLGHASLTTTQRYVEHLELAEIRSAVPWLPALSPLGGCDA